MTKTIDEVLEISLEKISNGEATIEECAREFPQFQTELREMLPLVVSLKSLEQIEPSPAFSQHAARRLVSKLPDKPVTFLGLFRRIFTKETDQPIRRFRISQSFVALLLAVSMLVASPFAVQATGPGDWLYGLDRIVEQTRLRLATDPELGLTLRLRFATERLEEVQQKLRQGKMENALTALRAYDEAIVEIAGLIEKSPVQDRLTLRTMTQETLALQAGILDRIRLSWPEDAQARNAYQKALQRSNMGIDKLFGPPETIPQGPGDATPQGPGEATPQGPGEATPQGPGEATPQGPGEATPHGPGEATPQGPGEATPQGPGEATPQGPGEATPQGPGEATPQGPGEATPQGPGEATPQGPGEATPQGPNKPAP